MIKDKIPVSVKKWDAEISLKIFKSFPKDEKNGAILKAIEFSCHNVLWIGVTLIGLYVSPDATFFRHLLVGIVSDIVHVAIIKAYSRRRRPSYGDKRSKDADKRSKDADEKSKDGAKANEDAESKDGAQGLIGGIDKHSFPSGHASRAIYFASLISNYYLGDDTLSSTLLSFLIYAWAVSVSASKVINGKNHLLDALFGALLGKTNYFIQFVTGSPINAIVSFLLSNILSTDYDDYLR